MIEKINKIPKIGQRIIRTAVAVFLVFGGFTVVGAERTSFYAAIATVLCTQPHLGSSKKAANNRIIGTFIGAFFGIMLTLLELYVLRENYQGIWQMLLVPLFIIVVLYSTVLLKRTPVAFFSCVVFLSITIIERGDTTPFSFIFFRVVDTLIGILVAFIVMEMHLPRGRRKEILFVSALDDTLLVENKQLSAYSKVDLNRLIEDGAKFTIFTGRTPASFISTLAEINVKLPVIAMDGAVLYDINENRYLLEYVIPTNVSNEIETILEQGGYHPFQNVILEDVLLIYYDEFENPVQNRYYEGLRKSPYRNYIRSKRPKEYSVVYFTLLDTKERLEKLQEQLLEENWGHRVRIKITENEFEGYSLMRIFSKNATRENMLHYVKDMTGAEKIVTFGSLEGQYDVVVRDNDMNQVVKTIKKIYEPVQFGKKTKEM